MNLFNLLPNEQPPKGIILTQQGGWVGTADVGDVVNINNETFRVVGPPQYDELALYAEIENGYILIDPDGSRRYYDMRDRLHRDDGPAVRWHGTVRWYRHGQLHREDGPAVIYVDGTEMWYHNNVLHRDDGPARTWPNGAQEWYYDGERHREDGPAIVGANGIKEYWLHGKPVNKEDLL